MEVWPGESRVNHGNQLFRVGSEPGDPCKSRARQQVGRGFSKSSHKLGKWASRGHSGKEPTCQCRRHHYETWVPSMGWEDSPGGGHGKPLRYSCLENPMDRGRWPTVHRDAKSRTRLSNSACTHTWACSEVCHASAPVPMGSIWSGRSALCEQTGLGILEGFQTCPSSWMGPARGGAGAG